MSSILSPTSEPLTAIELRRRSAWLVAELKAHFKRYCVAYALAASLGIVVGQNYRVAPQLSESLPQSMFLIHLNEPVRVGQFVAYRPVPNEHFPAGVIFTKLVVGVSGDQITVDDRVVSLNGIPVGWAKERSKKWKALDPIAPGTVPVDHIYVLGLHRDSFDSRYAASGLIAASQVVGRAYPLW